VPFPPAGGGDIVGRAVGERLSERLGQQVVIDNRGGASTVIGAELAARAPRDGYTLMLAPNTTMAVLPSLRRDLPYDPVRDFEPVSLLTTSPYLLVVHPALPAANVKELIALAKAKPGRIDYATPGRGTSNHLAAEMFKLMSGADFRHVPFKGTAQAYTSVMGGHVSMMFVSTASALPHVKAGRLRALGISTAQRNPAVPDIPTLAEAGVPGYHAASWAGIVAPRGTPRAIVDKLNALLAEVLRESELRQRLAAQGYDPEPSTPKAFADFIRSELARYGKLVKAAGITLD
jgi:tripartite-type tricarboxylate transporter receptor subunit TctC